MARTRRTGIVRKRSHKSGLPPGTPVHIGERKVERVRLLLLRYSGTEFEERELESVEECAGWRERGGVTWLHVTGVHDVKLLTRIGECFGLHPLVVEDISNTDQRPKLEDYEDYLFIVLRPVQDGRPEDGIDVEQVSMVLAPNFVLSFEEREPTAFDAAREGIRRNRGRIRSFGSDYLAYTLLDAMVDSYFAVLERLGERVEDLQENLVTDPAPSAQQDLQRLRYEMLLLRRSVWPLREVLGGLQRNSGDLVHERTRIYLRDVYDHAVQLIETIETLREMVSGLLEIYLTSLSNRLNEVMKVLTIIATIFIPLTFIAGVYGMNFRYMPELGWRWGYPVVLLVMAAIGGGLLAYFRRKRWI